MSVEIFAQAKAKEQPTDALPRFLAAYTSHKSVGTLGKDTQSGKMIDDWKNALNASDVKPQTVDIAPSISAVMAAKDEDELVSLRLSKGYWIGDMTPTEIYPYCRQSGINPAHSSHSAQAGNDFG